MKTGGPGRMFVCGVPKDSCEFARVLKVEQRLFGELSLPPAMAHQMFDFRPEIYAAVVGPDDSVAAYSSIYPLKKKWADAFVAGDTTAAGLPRAFQHLHRLGRGRRQL